MAAPNTHNADAPDGQTAGYARVPRNQRHNVIDLFAGPGGWDYGLRHHLGLDDVLGIEKDDAACATREAAGLQTLQADVTEVDPYEFVGARGLIASPPCQDFSLAGLGAGIDGERGRLMLEVPRWAEALQPLWIACEQVPPALLIYEQFAHQLRDSGYRTWTGLLNAADFGVPQTRQRAFLLASREPVLPPTPTHCKGGAATMFGTLAPWISMAEAVGWPESWAISQQRGEGMTERHGERPRRAATEPAFTVTGGVEGSSMRRWLLHTGANTMKHSRRTDEIVAYTRPITEPAPTVDGKAPHAWKVRNGELTRRVTLSEVTAFQTFPADYPWQGNKHKQGEQVGNAVPPLLAAHVVSAVARIPFRSEVAA